MKIKATISYTMDENHPDINCVGDWTEDKVYTFSDTYSFNDDYTLEDVTPYIKSDLKLVSGGGYNTEHIHKVTFDICVI